jgi:hypothetical protein
MQAYHLTMSGVPLRLRYHKPRFHQVPHDTCKGPFNCCEQAVRQPVPGEFVLSADDENTALAGDQPRVPDPGVEGGLGPP